MSLQNKVALITGGSRGLGKNAALRLAEKGADVVITYFTNKEAADSTKTEIEKLGRTCIPIQLDTRDVSSFGYFKTALQNEINAKLNKSNIDFLINNAGFGHHAFIAETSEEAFDDLMNVHFKGVFFLTQKLLDTINDGGRIINISSGLARFSFPGYAAYACMKGAVEVFTRYLAKELGARKITVNTLAPGAIHTDFNKAAFEAMPQVVEIIASQTALGRVGESDDIGGAIANLCTDEMAWVNAQRIEASGGMFT